MGGAYRYFGNVFKLTRGTNGKWIETVLHSFSSEQGDGAYPYSSLTFDSGGALYGTTYAGGNLVCLGGCGIVFRLKHDGNGKWDETILHSFSGGTDGGEPYAGVTFDPAGNLYGTTSFGGNPVCSSGCGVVFKLRRGANGQWIETVLQSLDGYNGDSPYGDLIIDAHGILYGTTLNGGDFGCKVAGGAGCGVVFKITPQQTFKRLNTQYQNAADDTPRKSTSRLENEYASSLLGE